ncbi:MAG: DsbA family protein [Marinicaulis sp.]|nr:DsbA family protein [Marinicaulis sp.]
MFFARKTIRPTYLVISALAFGLAACGGASSDEPGSSANKETIDNTVTGALGEMGLGDMDAPVTVIEYASVTCPHCATFHETIFPTIKENYIDTGKVRFIFREFPTAPAELSVVGSMLARCAADKGGSEAYFLITGSLFQTQRTWIYSDSPRNELIKIASQAGMSEADFDTCVKRKELLDLINENISIAQQRYNVNSTPSFVIDGQLRSISSVEAFSDALDAALENAAQ